MIAKPSEKNVWSSGTVISVQSSQSAHLTDDPANSDLVTPDATKRPQLLPQIFYFVGVHSSWWLKDTASMYTSKIDVYIVINVYAPDITATVLLSYDHRSIDTVSSESWDQWSPCSIVLWQPHCCHSVIGPFQLYISSGEHLRFKWSFLNKTPSCGALD